ncbi:qless [Carabus blaptoides fortunei]
MACIGSGRLCARVQEKLCQLGQTAQIKGKASYVRNKIGFQSVTRNLYQQCQNHLGHSTLPRSSSVAATTLCDGWHPCSNPDRGSPLYTRSLTTMHTHQPGSLPEYQIDPYRLLEDDLKSVYDEIRMTLRRNSSQEEVKNIVTYYFDGQGKAIRPMIAILMARAINYHLYKEESLLSKQKEIAMITEMMHSASLVHDDVIDQADFRRGKPSVNVLWNHKKVSVTHLLACIRSI